MKVGKVVKLLHDRKFGFIRADNLRSDVLFRYAVVEGPLQARNWYVGQEVEFDLDECRRLEHGELEAAKVQVASRPLSHRLVESELPGMSPAHHPKARRRKPIWRKNEDDGSANSSETLQDTPAPDDESA
jgi:cold shock CspA family protein